MNWLLCLFSGCFGILFFFFLFVYLGRRTKVYNLLFSLYCLSVINNIFSGYIFFTNSDIILNCYYPLSVHLSSGIFILFAHYFLDLNKTKLTRILLYYYILITFIFFIFAFISIKLNNLIFINLFFIFISITGIVFIVNLFKKIQFNKRKRTIKELFIIIGVIILIIHNSMYFYLLLFIKNFPKGINLIFVLFSTLSIAVALVKVFNQEYYDLIKLKNSLEKKVSERKIQLEDSHTQKINFFMNLAHETKTPLTLLLNYLEMDINKRGLSNEIKYVKQNADKLKKDMINFLDMEKLERGQIFYNHSQICNISRILKDGIDQFTDIAHNKNIDIKCEIEENIFVKIDPVALDRIINNLIENALKYTGENGEINVVLAKTFEKVLLKISDTGIGISKNQINNILDPYHQISYEKKNIQGIGMGLNIVKKIMDDIDGEIKVESKENEGSTFILNFQKAGFGKEDVLTLKSDEQKPKEDKCMINLVVNKNKYKTKNILLVEDNIDMLNYLYNVLSKYYNVYTAENGSDALKKLVNIPKPNLIISDIMMDVMDGYDFLDELQEMVKYQDIPFIFLTARTSEKDKISGLKKGAIDYIYKPFSNEELINKTISIIKIQEKQRKTNIKEIGMKFSNIMSKHINTYDNKLSFNIICNDHKITETEKVIIKLLINGYEYKDISHQTGKSLNFVRHQINKIYQKFNVKNKTELVKMFVQNS